jgi:hypothetical protein
MTGARAVDLDPAGALRYAPEQAIVTRGELTNWASMRAAYLVCQGRPCKPPRCTLHAPRAPLVGERIILGAIGTPRAVYRVVVAQRVGYIRMEREA